MAKEKRKVTFNVTLTHEEYVAFDGYRLKNDLTISEVISDLIEKTQMKEVK